jgi:hypothetical protein
LSDAPGIKEGLSKMVEDVMKPEKVNEEFNRSYLPKKHKKKLR